MPAWLDTVIAQNTDLSQAVDEFRDAQKLIVLGRGFNYSTAFEIALKLRKPVTCRPSSIQSPICCTVPVALIDGGFPVILLAPAAVPDRCAGPALAVGSARRAAAGHLGCSDVLSRVPLHLRLPTGVPEWLSPLVSVVPGQLFAGALAESSGQTPDRPRGLSKVTLTR